MTKTHRPADEASVVKFGFAPVTAAGGVFDIWDHAATVAAYPFPAAAAVTTVKSSSADDDGNPDSNTGAHKVTVEGLDSTWAFVSQTVTLNGTGAVALPTNLLRVHRAFTTEAGSGGVNAGTIDVLHTATVLARIAIGQGQTRMAVYTVPLGKELLLQRYNVEMAADGSFTARIMSRDASLTNPAWRVRHPVTARWALAEFEFNSLPIVFPEKTDVRIDVDVSANTDITAGFSGHLSDV